MRASFAKNGKVTYNFNKYQKISESNQGATNDNFSTLSQNFQE